MKYDILDEICMWNEERGLTEFDINLEDDMLREELTEFLLASNDVDRADALGDLIIVAVGSLFKLTGGNSKKVEDILMAITSANNLKGTTKNSAGKITKPANFVGPEWLIEQILKGE